MVCIVPHARIDVYWAGRVGRGNFFGTDDSCEIILVMYNESFIRKV